jgi:hypothetical protein
MILNETRSQLILYYIGRRPGEQGLRPWTINQERVEKLTTGTAKTKKTPMATTTNITVPTTTTIETRRKHHLQQQPQNMVHKD